MRRMIRLSVVAAVLALALHGSGPARASGSFEGHVEVLGPWGSFAMTAFQANDCWPDQKLQGVDGLVVRVQPGTSFSITTATPLPTVNYGVHLFDAACGYLGNRAFSGPGTASFTTDFPVTWLAITGGDGADVDFTITWS